MMHIFGSVAVNEASIQQLEVSGQLTKIIFPQGNRLIEQPIDEVIARLNHTAFNFVRLVLDSGVKAFRPADIIQVTQDSIYTEYGVYKYNGLLDGMVPRISEAQGDDHPRYFNGGFFLAKHDPCFNRHGELCYPYKEDGLWIADGKTDFYKEKQR